MVSTSSLSSNSFSRRSRLVVGHVSKVRIMYQDEHFKEHIESFTGLQARIIQHEYDHLEGVLFTDYVRGLRKQMIKSKLTKISKGKYTPFYEMSFPNKTK